jgi:putative lipoic acid-binding regulatory protein
MTKVLPLEEKTMPTLKPKKNVFEFPCPFPIKVFGQDQDNFEAFVLSIVQRHVSELGPEAVTTRPSRDGKYVAVTVTFTAENLEQLDALYLDLSGQQRILMLL